MKKVVVIGSGVGGSACAALLAKKGFSVTVLERNAFAGGKAASYDRDGFVCDMGVHYTGLGDAGPHGRVARAVGADLEFIAKDPFMRIMAQGRTRDFALNLITPGAMIKLALVAGVKPWNIPGVFRFLLKLLGIREIRDVEPYDDVSLRDFLNRYTRDQGFHTLMEIFCGLVITVPANTASAGEFLWCFANWAHAASSAYPKGGFREIPGSFLRAMEKHGGRIKTRARVESIRVENGRALGVETKDGFFPADVVVSNAGIKNTVGLAGEANFEKAYVNRVMALENSLGAVSVKYALDIPPLDIPILLYYSKNGDLARLRQQLESGKMPDDCPMFIPSPTFCDPNLAPPGKHLLLAGGASPPELADASIAETMLDFMEQKVKEIFPGIERHIIWKHRTNLDYINGMCHRGSGDVIGLAQIVGQVGKNMPSAKTPIKGLYLVGCDAGGRGIGTEQASDSALAVEKMISSLV